MKSFIKNIFGKKEVLLTPAQKIEKAKGQVSEALGMFSKVCDDLGQAKRTVEEAKIAEVNSINYYRQMIGKSEENILKAEIEFNSYSALQNKISEFVPKK